MSSDEVLKFGGNDWDLGFRYVTFKMPTKYPSGDIE